MQSRPQFRSLRRRLLGPLIATACLAAVLIAAASYWVGTERAKSDVGDQFTAIKSTLADAAFPLNALVIDSLAQLTRVDLITWDGSGNSTHSTIPIETATTELTRLRGTSFAGDSPLANGIVIGGRQYFVTNFDTVRSGSRADRVFSVSVLFDKTRVDSNRRRAAILPLATGLSTIIALTTITLLLSSRLVGRVSRLKRRVEAVAAGDFQSTVSDQVADEMGQLGGAVDNMANQLDRLWKTVNQQQSEKLLHQIAGGMAHQLRNSLTGARMAVELHQLECQRPGDDGLQIAVRQIELSEDYVRRLLLVASGGQESDRPQTVVSCCEDVRTSLSTLAQHLNIDVQWDIETSITTQCVRDGSRWTAAVTNLIHNAMDAGHEVQVELTLLNSSRLCVRVIDNGDGVPKHLADQLFEPFATSKSEGMGLGLPLVRRSADYLGGSVRWRRDDGRTVFEFETDLQP